MNISCKIIQDLLPLYHDNICSEDSKIIIEEHLKGCSDCQNYITNIDEDIFNDISNEKEEQIKVSSLKSLKIKILRKNIIISIVSILFTIVVYLGSCFIIFGNQNPIEYKNGLLDVRLSEDNRLDIIFKGSDYYASYAITKTIEKNGVKENAVYIYCTDTIWTKYISNKKTNESSQISSGNSIIFDYSNTGDSVDSEGDISRVYYLIGDYEKLNSMSAEDFNKVAKNANLIWKR